MKAQLDRIHRVNPSLDAVKFSLENTISPTANKTNIIVNRFFFKDIKIKFALIVLFFICNII